jgi:integrase
LRHDVNANVGGTPDHLHTLRHSAASFLLAAGRHTKAVQEHLGHSTNAVTSDIYSRVAPQQEREAADRLDEALQWYESALRYRRQRRRRSVERHRL